ncbi:MAG: type II 3-dehydroquinate dehydratase [Luteibaculum sp.]
MAKREPKIYGSKTLAAIMDDLQREFPDVEIHHVQSNSEGELVDAIQKYGLMCPYGIINGAGYTHTSVAMRDAIASVECEFVEVHISNIFKREEFRKQSFLSEVCQGVMTGFGPDVYRLAMDYIVRKVAREAS